MKISFTKYGWEDYEYWIETDKKVIKKIHKLIKEISRYPFEGTGKPEPLKGNLAGLWSRRIDREHRLVYEVLEGEVIFHQCRYHY
jgi:toxin YoeB